MLIWTAILASLFLVRLTVGTPTRPEQSLVRAVNRRRGQRPFPARR